MSTTKKTAGKTATKSSTNKSQQFSLMSFFEKEDSKFVKVGPPITIKKSDAKHITECVVKGYESKYGGFAKLYISITIKGKTLSLKGDIDKEGKKRRGVKLDPSSTKRLELDANEEVEIDPTKCILYQIKNIEDGTISLRASILK